MIPPMLAGSDDTTLTKGQWLVGVVVDESVRAETCCQSLAKLLSGWESQISTLLKVYKHVYRHVYRHVYGDMY